MIRFLTFEMWHNKQAGSTRLRVKQLLPHWPEAGLYKYGEKPDVMIYQKVYSQPDWQFMQHFEGIQILDICDPDWLDGVEVKKTLDAVDGVTTPSPAIAEFLAQMTDKPIKVVPDRHELSQFPRQATHKGAIKNAVWFGYKHNAVALRWGMDYLARKGVRLTVISNEDPLAYQWATNRDTSKGLYNFIKFNAETLNEELAKFDVAFLPVPTRPADRFKSNNRTVISWLSGLPVVSDAESFEKLNDPTVRAAEAKRLREKAVDEYDVKLSVEELKGFIKRLNDEKIKS